jgi:integrase
MHDTLHHRQPDSSSSDPGWDEIDGNRATDFAAYSRHTDASARRIHQGDRRRAPSQTPIYDRNLYKGRLAASYGCRFALANQGGPMRATTRMTKHVQAYLSLRRAFGFHLNISGQVLQSFARFADREAAGKPFTVELARRWAQSSSTGKQVTAARRLLIVQPFARYLRSIEPLTGVLPNRLLGPAQYRHIRTSTPTQKSKLSWMQPPTCVHAPDCAQSVLTYLGLLACTGMQPREPLRLTRADADLQANILTVRQTTAIRPPPRNRWVHIITTMERFP